MPFTGKDSFYVGNEANFGAGVAAPAKQPAQAQPGGQPAPPPDPEPEPAADSTDPPAEDATVDQPKRRTRKAAEES